MKRSMCFSHSDGLFCPVHFSFRVHMFIPDDPQNIKELLSKNASHHQCRTLRVRGTSRRSVQTKLICDANGGAFHQKIIELPLLINGVASYGPAGSRCSLAGVESSNTSHFVGLCQEQQETECINETRRSVRWQDADD